MKQLFTLITVSATLWAVIAGWWTLALFYAPGPQLMALSALWLAGCVVLAWWGIRQIVSRWG